MHFTRSTFEWLLSELSETVSSDNSSRPVASIVQLSGVEFLSLRHFGDRIISTIFVCIPDTAVCIPYCIKDRFFTPAVEITNAKMSLREKIFHPNTLTLVTKNAIDCRR